jgi:hypothetical protein
MLENSPPFLTIEEVEALHSDFFFFEEATTQ